MNSYFVLALSVSKLFYPKLIVLLSLAKEFCLNPNIIAPKPLAPAGVETLYFPNLTFPIQWLFFLTNLN